MTFTYDQFDAKSDFVATEETDEGERFEQLLGFSPWLVIAAKPHVSIAEQAVKLAREEGHRVDLLCFSNDDADFDVAAAKAAGHRHIVTLETAQGVLDEHLRSTIADIAVMPLKGESGASEVTPEQVLEIIRKTPRCC